MAESKLPTRSEDYNEWYNALVLQADLADYGPARGTMIVKPYGWAIWENMQQALDRRFKATGHVNAGFPMFIPKSFLEREAAHVEGFAPELAVVTIGGGKELAEPLVVRPTSETLVGHTYARWIKSYRDLPILINQWNSVVRWEMRTKLFLRTLEFWWQEGHTAHATAAEGDAEARQMLDVYLDFARKEAAIAPYSGRKTPSERFAGANVTYTLEAMMGDGRALQACTSHDLGQNFAKAFNIQYLDPNNELQYCWTTSWGLSTRFVGAVIMTHGDDKGLVLPPRLAPHQVVIVPIYKQEAERTAVLEVAEQLRQALADANVRVKLDARDELTPGYKFNDWELRGVPLRIEIGPRDVAAGSAMLARRDIPGRDGKTVVAQPALVPAVVQLLETIQQALYDKADAHQRANTFIPRDYAEFQEIVAKGFAFAGWCGSADCEARIKEETKATSRCIPFEQPEEKGVCIRCRQPAVNWVYFARAY